MAANDMVLCVEMETDEMDVPLDLETLPIRAIPPSQDHVFYPQVSNELKPFKGQEFKTWEEAHVFYTKYASAAGFVVRIGSSRRSRKTNEFIRKEFFCNRQGNGPRELTGNEKRIRGVVREDCKARMIVGRVKTGGFVVNIFDEVTVRKTLLEKRGLLFQQYSHVIDSVVLSEEASKLFCETMESLIEKIKPLLNSDEGVEPCATRSSTHQTGFREPDEVRTKGRAKRIKRGKEKANGKRNSTGRHCHGCGKDGQIHDKRNCPMLLNLNQ
ncbi:hypothetical protein ACLB2K_048608 [Fragaria x ananassa]